MLHWQNGQFAFTKLIDLTVNGSKHQTLTIIKIEAKFKNRI
jgi:hypothetical protein